MEGGDISNKLASAVVIDIEGLIYNIEGGKVTSILEKMKGWLSGTKYLDRLQREVDRYKLVDDNIIGLLEFLIFNYGLYVILYLNRPNEYYYYVDKLLDDDFIPYSRLLVGGKTKLERVLKREHIKWYFYTKKENGSTFSKQKERQVENWTDVGII